MTSLSQKIVAAVDHADPVTPGSVTATADGISLTLHLMSAGPVGLAFSSLEFSTTGPELAPDALRAWADRLANQVTYLMEPLVVLEHDALAGEVELRSQSPTPRGQLKCYYEIRLTKAGTLSMTRIVFDPSTKTRSAMPCQLTRETLERLADDLVNCAA